VRPPATEARPGRPAAITGSARERRSA
jgi:hypothetical protein